MAGDRDGFTGPEFDHASDAPPPEQTAWRDGFDPSQQSGQVPEPRYRSPFDRVKLALSVVVTVIVVIVAVVLLAQSYSDSGHFSTEMIGVALGVLVMVGLLIAAAVRTLRGRGDRR